MPRYEKPWSPTNPASDIDWTAVGRTETGIFLVIISLVLGPIPYLTYIGTVVGLVGVIMIIIGRKVFGQKHSNLVLLAVSVWVVGSIIGFLVIVSYSLDVTTTLASGLSQQALNSAFDNFEIGFIIVAAILGMSNVLLTFSLQSNGGRVVLLAAYGTSLAIGIFVASIITSQINMAVVQSVATQDLAPLNNLQAQSQLLGLFGLIPAIMWAFAYYKVYQRIANREIPDPKTIRAEN